MGTNILAIDIELSIPVATRPPTSPRPALLGSTLCYALPKPLLNRFLLPSPTGVGVTFCTTVPAPTFGDRWAYTEGLATILTSQSDGHDDGPLNEVAFPGGILSKEPGGTRDHV